MPWKPLALPTDDETRELRDLYRGKLRMLVDENAGPGIADFLRGGGFNVAFAGELGLLGRSDEDVFAMAWKEKRVIVTHDMDFLDNRRFPPHRNPGVIRIAPGADGRDQEGLRRCLAMSTLLGGNMGAWYKGKKLDFTSIENLTIYYANGTKSKFKWIPGVEISEWQD